MSTVGVSLSLARTVFEYFNPTRSPYYALVVFCLVALISSTSRAGSYWLLVGVPVFLVLMISVVLSSYSYSKMGSAQYNYQLRFARVFSISVAAICVYFIVEEKVIYTGEIIQLIENTKPKDRYVRGNDWSVLFIVAYLACVLQIFTYMFYVLIYHNYDSTENKTNFVQHSLIHSSLLFGLCYVAADFHFKISLFPIGSSLKPKPFELSIESQLLFFGIFILWMYCEFVTLRYVLRNVQLNPPQDVLNSDLSPLDVQSKMSVKKKSSKPVDENKP